VVLLVAILTNPGQSSLERSFRASNQVSVLTRSRSDLTFTRRNRLVFSEGLVEGHDPRVHIEVMGAFGHWWFELLDTFLYE